MLLHNLRCFRLGRSLRHQASGRKSFKLRLTEHVAQFLKFPIFALRRMGLSGRVFGPANGALNFLVPVFPLPTLQRGLRFTAGTMRENRVPPEIRMPRGCQVYVQRNI